MAKQDRQFIFDLMSEIRKNPRRRIAIEKAMLRVDTVTKAIQEGKATREDLSEAQAGLIPVCGFNFGLLMPQFFPAYPMDDPLSFIPRPFMFAMSSLASNATVTLKAGRQIGKCADKDTKVITEKHGSMTLGDIFDCGIPCS